MVSLVVYASSLKRCKGRNEVCYIPVFSIGFSFLSNIADNIFVDGQALPLDTENDVRPERIPCEFSRARRGNLVTPSFAVRGNTGALGDDVNQHLEKMLQDQL